MQINTIPVGIDNCYIVRDEGTILIDAGMPGQFNKFARGLNKLNIPADEISLIIVTHAHWDHIGCLKKIKEQCGAKVALHSAERAIVEEGKSLMPPGVTRWGKWLGPKIGKWSQKFKIEKTTVDIVLESEDYNLEDFGIKGKVVFTPGHSYGSVSVILESGEAFVGDMAMNGPPLTLRPNLPIFAEDMPLLMKSWQKIKTSGVKQIFPAHGKSFPFTKIEKKIA